MTAPALRRRALVVELAGAAFIALTLAAMVTYRGGSRFDVGARHYQFLGNFFSDLGDTVTYSGRTNMVPRALFAIALIAVGSAFAWSGPVWYAWVGRTEARVAAILARVVVVPIGIAFAAIGVTPWNRDPGLHLALVRTSFALLLVFVASVLVLQVRNGALRPWLAANLAFVAVLAVYVALVTVGPSVATVAGMRIQIVAQKLVVYGAVVNLAVQAWGATRADTGPAPAAGVRRSRHGEVSASSIARSTVSNGPRRKRASQRRAIAANASQNATAATK
jgi:hypothetical protein